MPPSMIRPRRWALAATLALLAVAASAAAALAKTSHEGWPRINGVLLMNKRDQNRPLDARPGHDLFGGADRSYSCDGLHKNRSCAHSSGVVARRGHNELLGGHGNDTIFAGPQGDVIWGDYKPSGQPSSQVDRLTGGNSQRLHLRQPRHQHHPRPRRRRLGQGPTSAAGSSTAAAAGTSSTSAAARRRATRSATARRSRTRRWAIDERGPLLGPSNTAQIVHS